MRVALALLLAACGRTGTDVSESGEQSGLPPAAALSAETGIGLEARLERLDADLGAVLEGNLDEQSQAYLLAAEALTDRLLEEQPGVEWLGTGYYVEARLRQVRLHCATRLLLHACRPLMTSSRVNEIASMTTATAVAP